MEAKMKYMCPNEMFDMAEVSRELVERQAVETFIRSAPIDVIRKVFHVTIDSVKEGVIVDVWL